MNNIHDPEKNKPEFVFLRDQELLTDADFEIANRACQYIKNVLAARPEYIKREKLDPQIYLPAAMWSLDSMAPIYVGYKQLLGGNRENITHLRLFSQIFTGYRLIDMKDSRGSHIPLGVPQALDQSLEVIAGRRDEFVERYAMAIKKLPPFLHISPPRKFGEIGWVYDGKIVNRDTYAYLERLALLYESGLLNPVSPISLLQRESLNILEIGAGYGGLAFYLKKLLPQARYYIIDLPESLIYSAIYLSVLFQDEENLLIRPYESNGAIKQKQMGFTFLPNYLFPRLSREGVKIDLAINTLSMSEMSKDQVREYCHHIKNMIGENGFFFEQNQDNRICGNLNASDIIAEYFPLRQDLGKDFYPGLTQGSAHLWRNSLHARVRSDSSSSEDLFPKSQKDWNGPTRTLLPRGGGKINGCSSNLFASGNYTAVAMAGRADEWQTYAALGLMGKIREGIEGLSHFAHQDARFYLAVAHWIDGDETTATQILKEIQNPHAQRLLALIRKPQIHVLAQLPWSRRPPHDLLTAASKDSKFVIHNISFHPEDLPNEPYADIHKFFSSQRPPDFYICQMVEWHLIPPNLEQLPCPIFGATGDYDLHIQTVHPWLNAFDELIVTDSTEWEDVRRLVGSPVSTFPKSFGVRDGLPPVPKAPREIDVFLSGSTTHPYWYEKGKLLHQVLKMPDITMLVIDGFLPPETYQLVLGQSKLTFSYVRHSGAMPTRALEALSMGCAAIVQKGSAITLFLGEKEGVFTYDFHGEDLAPTIRKVVTRWPESEQCAWRGAEIIRQEFALPRVASQYLRYLTFLAAKPRGKREIQPERSLDQKRSVLGKGWLPGGVTILQEMLQKNVTRWKPRLKNKTTPHLFIDMARELVLNYAAVYALMRSKNSNSPGEKSGITDILSLYKTGLAQFPHSLVLRFNLIRTSLHLGQKPEISEALKLAEETVQVPISNWQIDIMEDVFPYDFESNFFNYRKYFDEVTESLMKGISASAALSRLILASLFFYLGFYTQNIPHLKQAIILDPDFPVFKLEYARQLVRRGAAGDYQEAGTLLTQLTDSSILFPEAFELLKRLHTRGLYRSDRFAELGRFVNRFHHSIFGMPS
jgi:tetratricopeptide (TPR) repeat protein